MILVNSASDFILHDLLVELSVKVRKNGKNGLRSWLQSQHKRMSALKMQWTLNQKKSPLITKGCFQMKLSNCLQLVRSMLVSSTLVVFHAYMHQEIEFIEDYVCLSAEKCSHQTLKKRHQRKSLHRKRREQRNLGMIFCFSLMLKSC